MKNYVKKFIVGYGNDYKIVFDSLLYASKDESTATKYHSKFRVEHDEEAA